MGHTGGFDEPTCQRCHSDHAVNDPWGSLLLTGVPGVFTAGAGYRITITLERTGIGQGGFQLAARFADGPGGGQQAGTLRPLGGRLQVTTHEVTAVQYA